MSSFVPTQFSSFTSNFNFDKLKQAGSSGTWKSKFANLRTPKDFFDVTRMSKPNGVVDAQQRISYNLNYFSANYLLIVAIVSLYLIFTDFPLLILILFDAVTLFLIQYFFGESDELDLRFITLQKNILYTIILIVNLPVLFIASPITTLLWLLTTNGVLILGHAVIMDKPVEASYSNDV